MAEEREKARWWLLEINEKGLNIRKTEGKREKERKRIERKKGRDR